MADGAAGSVVSDCLCGRCANSRATGFTKVIHKRLLIISGDSARICSFAVCALGIPGNQIVARISSAIFSSVAWNWASLLRIASIVLLACRTVVWSRPPK